MKNLYVVIAAVFFCPLLVAQDALVIFPGDYNNDGIVNHYDILPLGIAMFHEGIPREPASSVWEGQLLEMPWPQSLPVSGINYGFIDGDGNGFISPDDLDVIVQNYDSSQTGAIPSPQPYQPGAFCQTCAVAQIMVNFDQSAVFTNDTITGSVSIAFEPGTLPEAGAVGLAFNVHYNADWIVESTLEVWPDTSGDDLMFLVATINGVQGWKSSSSGIMELGLASKTGTQSLYESRTLFHFRTIVEDLIIRSTEDTLVVPFTFEISELMMLNIMEENVPFSVHPDTVWLIDPATSVNELMVKGNVRIVPNPATDAAHVIVEGLAVTAWQIVATSGQIVGFGNVPAGHSNFALPLQNLTAGVYTLIIFTPDGMVARSLLKP